MLRFCKLIVLCSSFCFFNAYAENNPSITRLYEFFKNAHNINDVAKIQPKNLRNTDESWYPLAQLVDPVVKPRGFGDFFIKSNINVAYKHSQVPLPVVHINVTLPRLTTNGTTFVDSSNQRVYLRGVNLMSKTAQSLFEIGFDETHAQFMRTNNFRFVRLGVLWSEIEPSPNQFNDNYLKQIATVVEMLAAQGIYTFIDFHQDQFAQIFGDGAPSWAVILPDYATSTPDFGFNANLYCAGYLSQTSLNCRTDINYSYASFWANALYQGVGLQQYYANMVKYVISKFRYLKGDIIGYEIMNEPYYGIAPGGGLCGIATLYPPTAKPCPPFDTALGSFYDTVIKAIRSVDEDTNILYEPGVLFSLGGYSNPPINVVDNKLIFSYHNYDIYTPYTFQQVFDIAATVAKTDHIQTIMTEFGANEHFLSTHIAVTPAAVTYANQISLSYTYWAYNDNANYKISNGKSPAYQAIIADMSRPFDANNVNYTVLGYLKTLYVFKTLNIDNVSVTGQAGQYTLSYTQSAPTAKITLNVANGCVYTVQDAHGVPVTTSLDGDLEIITLNNTSTGPLTVTSTNPTC